jgi:hypothetical protein
LEAICKATKTVNQNSWSLGQGSYGAHHKYTTAAKPTRGGRVIKFDTDSFHTQICLSTNGESIIEQDKKKLISSSNSGEQIHVDIWFRQNCT